MKILILEGSPERATSYSEIVFSWIAKGLRQGGESRRIAAKAAGDTEFQASSDTTVTMAKLSPLADRNAAAEAFLDADTVIFAFSYAADRVPPIVKGFLNRLADEDSPRMGGKRIVYLVRSSPLESRGIEAFATSLERLSTRLGMVYIGVVAHIEGMGPPPYPWISAMRKADAYFRVGSSLAAWGRLDPAAIAYLSRPSRLACANDRLFSSFARGKTRLGGFGSGFPNPSRARLDRWRLLPR